MEQKIIISLTATYINLPGRKSIMTLECVLCFRLPGFSKLWRLCRTRRPIFGYLGQGWRPAWAGDNSQTIGEFAITEIETLFSMVGVKMIHQINMGNSPSGAYWGILQPSKIGSPIFNYICIYVKITERMNTRSEQMDIYLWGKTGKPCFNDFLFTTTHVFYNEWMQMEEN